MVVLKEKFNSTFLLVFAILQSVLGNLAIMRRNFGCLDARCNILSYKWTLMSYLQDNQLLVLFNLILIIYIV